MYPILFKIGPIPIAGYGTMLAIGFLVAYYFAIKEFDRRKLSRKLIDNIIMYAILGGIIGSKLWAAFEENFDMLMEHPIRTLFSGSGFSAHGGYILAFILCVVLIRYYKTPSLKVFDATAPSLILGYGFGRLGCLLAGDGCYGIACNLPWAMSFPHGTVPTLAKVHPTPIYEALWAFSVFAFLWMLRKKVTRRGDLFYMYLMLFGLGRFLVEFIRLNERVLFGLTTSQLFSITILIIGAIGLLYNRFRGQPA